MPSAEEHELRLRAILHELADGILQGPAASADVFGRYTAPEYLFTSPSGELSARDEILAALREGSMHFASYAMSDIEIRLYGDVAVVVGRVEGDGVNPGGERFRGAHRFTSVWYRAQGDWTLVAWQATAMANEVDRLACESDGSSTPE